MSNVMKVANLFGTEFTFQAGAAIALNGLVYTNLNVQTSSWIHELTPTYPEYPYRSDLVCLGCTPDCSPDVRFNYTQVMDGNFAPIANADLDRVSIYAKTTPSSAFTIPMVICNTDSGTNLGVLEGLMYSNVLVETTSWVNEAAGGASPTYANYPMRADILCAGVNADFSPDVRFNYRQIMDGIYALIANTDENVVKIYASQIPSTDIVIPAIICTKKSD